jgi:hypothetical protein
MGYLTDLNCLVNWTRGADIFVNEVILIERILTTHNRTPDHSHAKGVLYH